MRYSDMRDMIHERAALLDKKRLGKNQKARLATLSEKLDSATQPPATPPRANTGERADFQGNVYEMHRHSSYGVRKMRREIRFGHGTEKPLRSRVQRETRKRRTGGVK